MVTSARVMDSDQVEEDAAPAADIPGEFSWKTCASWFLGRPAAVQVLVWFLVILGLKWWNLFEPPVWDSAMGIFPPAAYLYDTNFDICSLLHLTAWEEGGPNVHSLSLITWILAVVMKLTGSPSMTFLVMHLLTYAAFAWALQGFTAVLRSYGLAARTAVAAAVFLLLIPMVLVQVGALYAEVPVLCTGIAAWVFWRRGSSGLAVMWCVIGIYIKLTAIPVAALVGAALLFSGRPYDARKVLLILVLPVALWVNLALPGWLGATPHAVHDWGDPDRLLWKFKVRMQLVPDVRWLLRLALFSGIAYPLVRIWRERKLDMFMRTDPDSRSRLICLAMPYVFLTGVLAMIYSNSLFLSRYLLPVLPFSIGSVLLLASQFAWFRIRGETVAFVLLLGACVYSGANYNGRFYHPAYASFSVVERSHAYRDFHAIQIEAINALADKPDGMPAYVSREIDYMISHRMMGYVEESIPNTFPIYVSPHKDLVLETLPDACILLRTNASHGGSKIGSLVRKARASDDYAVTERLIERNGFKARLYRVIRVGG